MAPEEIEHCDAVIALRPRFTAASFTGNDRLAIIACWGVGYDRIVVPACTETNVLLAITMDHITLSPHGMAWTDELYREYGVGACAYILTILRGKVPRYTVNREVVERPGFQAKLQSLHNRWTMLTG